MRLQANADMARDLEEAEEELERVKVIILWAATASSIILIFLNTCSCIFGLLQSDYEGQVSKLRNEKNALQTELAEWKRKIIGQQKKLIRR